MAGPSPAMTGRKCRRHSASKPGSRGAWPGHDEKVWRASRQVDDLDPVRVAADRVRRELRERAALRIDAVARQPMGQLADREEMAAGGYEDFVTGFMFAGSYPPRVWGSPAGLAVAKDGSLLIADEQTIWRVAYTGK